MRRGSFFFQRAVNFFRRQRQLEEPHAHRVGDSVGNRCRRRVVGKLADGFGIERADAAGPEHPDIQLSVGDGPATPGRSVVFRIVDNGIVWLTADPSSGLTALHGVTDPDLFCSSLGTEGRQITPLQFLFQRNGGSHLLVQEAVHHALVYRTVSFDICGELAGLEAIAEGDVRFRYHDNDAGGTSPGGNAFGSVAVGTVADREHGSDPGDGAHDALAQSRKAQRRRR